MTTHLLFRQYACGCLYYEQRRETCGPEPDRCQSEVCHPYHALAELDRQCPQCGRDSHHVALYAWDGGTQICREISDSASAQAQQSAVEIQRIKGTILAGAKFA